MTQPADTTASPPSVPVTDPVTRLAAGRLLLCAVLFGGWMLYLAALALTRPEVQVGPRILSRPQVLLSLVDVVARVDPASPEVVVENVLHGDPDLKGKTLRVTNLGHCGPPRSGVPGQPDIASPGSYLLLLLPDPLKPDTYLVAPLPPSPGFSRDIVNPRAYQATPDILGQYRQVVKPSR